MLILFFFDGIKWERRFLDISHEIRVPEVSTLISRHKVLKGGNRTGSSGDRHIEEIQIGQWTADFSNRSINSR